MIDVRFRPLSQFPRQRTPATKRRASPFGIKFEKMLDSLEREMKHLSAKDVVVEADFNEDDIRMDGWPRSSAREPRDPGVVLNFLSKHGPLRLPCDAFKNWRDNLRAVALHLEHLRLAALYGVGEYGEQYKGWLRLEAGAPIAMDAGMTVEDAARLLAAITLKTDPEKLPATGPVDAREVDSYLSIYRRAAAIAHPDQRGGDRSMWDRLQKAKAVLDVFHGVKKNVEASA